MLLFRTEASAKTGFGHLKRSACLASFLKSHTDILFCIPNDKAAVRFLEEGRQRFVTVKDLTDPLSRNPAAIIFDLREFTAADVRLLHEAKALHIPTIQITDLGLSQQEADYTFDGALTPLIPYEKGKPVFQGPDYMPLHHRFRHFHKARRLYRQKIRRVLISLGGAASYRHLRDLTDIFSRHGCRVKIAPGFYLKKNSVKILRRLYPGLQVVGKTESLARAFYETDLAVITAGVAAAEAAATGAPCLYFHYHNEQKFIAESWQNAGTGLVISKIDEIKEEAVLNALRSLTPEKRAEMGALGKKLCDGGGAMRIVAFLKEKEIIQ